VAKKNANENSNLGAGGVFSSGTKLLNACRRNCNILPCPPPYWEGKERDLHAAAHAWKETLHILKGLGHFIFVVALAAGLFAGAEFFLLPLQLVREVLSLAQQLLVS
jgi:hypothetical protein